MDIGCHPAALAWATPIKQQQKRLTAFVAAVFHCWAAQLRRSCTVVEGGEREGIVYTRGVEGGTRVPWSLSRPPRSTDRERSGRRPDDQTDDQTVGIFWLCYFSAHCTGNWSELRRSVMQGCRSWGRRHRSSGAWGASTPVMRGVSHKAMPVKMLAPAGSLRIAYRRRSSGSLLIATIASSRQPLATISSSRDDACSGPAVLSAALDRPRVHEGGGALVSRPRNGWCNSPQKQAASP